MFKSQNLCASVPIVTVVGIVVSVVVVGYPLFVAIGTQSPSRMRGQGLGLSFSRVFLLPYSVLDSFCFL